MNGFDLEKSIRILKSRKITKEQVADRMGISRGYLSKVINGKKPLTQTFVDLFAKEFGSQLEGVELLEVSDENTMARQIGLEAKVEVLSETVLGLVKCLGEISSTFSGKGLDPIIKRATKELLTDFDEKVEAAAAQILKKRAVS